MGRQEVRDTPLCLEEGSRDAEMGVHDACTNASTIKEISSGTSQQGTRFRTNRSAWGELERLVSESACPERNCVKFSFADRSACPGMYMAPEVLAETAQQPHLAAIDMWAAGVLLHLVLLIERGLIWSSDGRVH